MSVHTRSSACLFLAVAASAAAPPPTHELVMEQQRRRDYCASSDSAKALAEAAPEETGRWVLYADGAAYCGRREEALAALAKADALPADSSGDVAAYLYLYLQEPARSLAASTRYLAAQPGDAWHLLRRAQAAAAAGERRLSAKALAAASKAARSGGCAGAAEAVRESRAHYILSWAPAGWDGARAAALRESLRPAASAAVARLERCAAGDADALLEAARLRLALKERAAALADLDAAEKEGLSPRLWLAAASARRQARDWDGARRALAAAAGAPEAAVAAEKALLDAQPR